MFHEITPASLFIPPKPDERRIGIEPAALVARYDFYKRHDAPPPATNENRAPQIITR